MAVGMPIRTERAGRITPSRAALLSAEIATDAATEIEPGWDGQEVVFCRNLLEEMQQMFSARYPGIGAKVTQQ